LRAQFNKGGYLLLDSLIMRGAYGPYGPAKSQVGMAAHETRKIRLSSATHGLPLASHDRLTRYDWKSSAHKRRAPLVLRAQQRHAS